MNHKRCPHTLRRLTYRCYHSKFYNKESYIVNSDNESNERLYDITGSKIDWKILDYIENNSMKKTNNNIDDNRIEFAYLVNTTSNKDIDDYINSKFKSEPNFCKCDSHDFYHKYKFHDKYEFHAKDEFIYYDDLIYGSYEYADLSDRIIPLNFSIEVSDSVSDCQPNTARIYKDKPNLHNSYSENCQYHGEIDDWYQYWKPKNIESSYFSVDMGKDILISHIGIMGRPQKINEQKYIDKPIEEWVKSFDLFGKLDESNNWIYINTYKANKDPFKEVVNQIDTKSIKYRYYKIVPISYHNGCSMRVMFYGNIDDQDQDKDEDKDFDNTIFDIVDPDCFRVSYKPKSNYQKECSDVSARRSDSSSKRGPTIKDDKSERYKARLECRKYIKGLIE
jgi:hypothetical protein